MLVCLDNLPGDIGQDFDGLELSDMLLLDGGDDDRTSSTALTGREPSETPRRSSNDSRAFSIESLRVICPTSGDSTDGAWVGDSALNVGLRDESLGALVLTAESGLGRRCLL